VTATAAFALSRKDFIDRNIITAIFTFTMFFSGGLIPSYLIVRSLGMRDTLWALIIPSAASMYNIIIARTFFQTNIPFELQEAAAIDGCSITRMFISIVLPLSAPILAVLALFYGVAHWNAWFNAMIFIRKRELFPLQLILREIIIQNSTADMTLGAGAGDAQMLSETIKYAVIISATLPILTLYPFLQKYFISGLTAGANKG